MCMVLRMEELIAKEKSDRETIQQLEFDYLAFKRERSVRMQGNALLGFSMIL